MTKSSPKPKSNIEKYNEQRKIEALPPVNIQIDNSTAQDKLYNFLINNNISLEYEVDNSNERKLIKTEKGLVVVNTSSPSIIVKATYGK